MRTDLDHLPPGKERELERVVQILFEEFDEARSLSTQEWKKKGRVLKIILYGSYARGGWVDEPHTAKGYQSDFDLLIIVNDKRLTDRVEYWAKAEERLNRELSITKALKTPVNFIVHTLHEVNDGLAHGRSSSSMSRRTGSRFTRATTASLPSPGPRRPPRRWQWRRNISRSGFRALRTLSKAQNRISEGLRKHAAFDLTKPQKVSITACCLW